MTHNYPSPEEEPQQNDKRGRDVQTLTRLLEKLNTNVIDDAFERSANRLITWELYHIYLGFTAQVESSAFHLIDKELDSRVRALYDAWIRIFSYEPYFDPRPEFWKFISPHMADDQADVIIARENFDDDFVRFRDAYLAFMEYVKDQYVEDIDLRKTNQVAQDSFPLPSQIPEDKEPGETETEPEEPATTQPEKESTPFHWNAFPSWMKCFGAFLVGLATVAGCVVTIIILFYGEALCSQQNPPKAFQRVLPYVCPKDPDPGEEPTVSVTLTFTPTATETITPPNTPTLTPTPSQSPTPTITHTPTLVYEPALFCNSVKDGCYYLPGLGESWPLVATRTAFEDSCSWPLIANVNRNPDGTYRNIGSLLIQAGILIPKADWISEYQPAIRYSNGTYEIMKVCTKTEGRYSLPCVHTITSEDGATGLYYSPLAFEYYWGYEKDGTKLDEWIMQANVEAGCEQIAKKLLPGIKVVIPMLPGD